jgi:hypothetical protein
LAAGDVRFKLTVSDSVDATTDILPISGTNFALGYEVGAAVAFDDKLNDVGDIDKVGENVAVGKLVGDSSTNVFDTTGLVELITVDIVAATKPTEFDVDRDNDRRRRRLLESSENVI